MGCSYMTLVMCLIFCFHVRTGESDLSCHTSNACSSLRNVTCRFEDLGPFGNFPGFDSLTNKPWPSEPLCHSITAVHDQNGTEIMLNITWKGPSDASFQKLKGFLIETMIFSNANPNPIGRYSIDLKNNVDLFKDDAFFETIRNAIFKMMCVYRPRARGSVNFYISSTPSPVDDTVTNTCKLSYSPVTTPSSQNKSTFLPTVTAPPSLTSEEVPKPDNQRTSAVTAIVIPSAVCFVLLVIIVTFFLCRERKHSFQNISISESESGTSVSSFTPIQTLPPTDNTNTMEREYVMMSRQSSMSLEDSIMDDEINREILRINFGTFDNSPLCEVEHYI